MLLELGIDKNDYNNIEITVFTEYAGEPNSDSSTDLKYSDYGEYCYVVEVGIAGDFGENIGEVGMKIRYQIDNLTY